MSKCGGINRGKNRDGAATKVFFLRLILTQEVRKTLCAQARVGVLSVLVEE